MLNAAYQVATETLYGRVINFGRGTNHFPIATCWQNEGFRVLESTGASCVLRKRPRQRGEIVRKNGSLAHA